MRTISLLALPLLIIGCKTKPPPAKPGNDIGGAFVRRQEAQIALKDRALKACEHFSASKESPESIGHTVVSTCAPEIGNLVDRMAEEELQNIGSTPVTIASVKDKKPQWRRDVEAQVNRDAVAWIVTRRTDHQSAQEK